MDTYPRPLALAAARLREAEADGGRSRSQPVSEDRDTEWVPIRNREYVAAPSQLELEGEDDWVLWIEADSDLEPDDQDGGER